MATVVEVIEAMGAALDTIDGLRVTEYVPDQPNLPAAWVVPPDIDYHQAFQGGLRQFDVTVAVFVSMNGSDRVRAKHLLRYLDSLGPYSIPAALEAKDANDLSLSATCQSVVVNRFRPLGIEEIAATQMYGGAFDVTVHPVKESS